MIVLDQAAADALYGSTKSLATVGPNPAVDDGPKWFKVTIVASMLLTLLSAACFTGGLINRLVDSRLTGLLGRRAVPRRDHVVVVGLGQVGLRLCLLLRECGVPVVAVDTEAEGENVGFARRVKLPVVIGRGANPDVLRRLSLARARSIAPSRRSTCATSRPRSPPAPPTPTCASCCAPATATSPTRRARWSGSGTCSTCTVSAPRTSPGSALGKDAEAVAIRDGRPQLALASGQLGGVPARDRALTFQIFLKRECSGACSSKASRWIGWTSGRRCCACATADRGRRVVLLHGHPRTHTTWHRVAPRLVDAGFRVVCPDLPGYGESRGSGDQLQAGDGARRRRADGSARLRRVRGRRPRPRLAASRTGSRSTSRRVSRLAVMDGVPFARGARALRRALRRRAGGTGSSSPRPPSRPRTIISRDPLAWYTVDAAAMGAENHADWRARGA